MLKEDLKKRAISLVKIPADFFLNMEDYVEGEDGDGEAIFSWVNGEQDEGIFIKLDFFGNLTSLSIDKKYGNPDAVLFNVEKSRNRAEQFLLSHYPAALKSLSLFKTQRLAHADRFYYEQVVMDLPLEQAGCYLDVDAAGNIVNFTYNGIKRVPEIPKMVISKEKLMEDVKSRLDFDLTITNLLASIHTVKEDCHRLVYEPGTFMRYKADALKPELTITHEDEDPITYASLPKFSETEMRRDLSNEAIIGISERMEIIREIDMGEETGIVWRDRDWEMREADLSMNGFFKRQTEDTVKAFISKETGKVRSFMWFNERRCNLELSPDECYQKAIEFLQMIIPDYYPYLQLIVQDLEEESDDERMKESFTFHLHNGHGIPFQLELIMVMVNRRTGKIDHYSGPSIGIEKLRQIPAEPAISTKEARKIYLNHLDFELSWNLDYASDTESYILVYQACDRFSRTQIRYIDAISGEVIFAKGE